MKGASCAFAGSSETRMGFSYDEERKDLPCGQLHRLFMRVGWSDGSEDADMLKNFSKPFIHSTFVVSAWQGDTLIGAVRVLSDQIIRSEIYDLAVDPDFQGNGVGRELLRRCMARFPGTEWFLRTTQEAMGFYQKLGFKTAPGIFLSIPSKYTAEP